VRCRNCGHDNADGNRFCGTCGDSLGKSAAQPEYVIERILEPLKLDWEPAASSGQISPRREAELDLRPADTSEPMAAVSPTAPPPRRDRWAVDGGGTTVGGPSFLGLSNSGLSATGGYSYLFRDEPERSHTALWVFLLVLLALGALVYAKWQPIRDYVLTTAITHSRPKPPAAQESDTAATTTPGNTAPITTLATTDAPTRTAAEKQPEKIANLQEGLPEGDKGSAADASKSDQGASSTPKNAPSPATTRPDDSAPKQPSAKTQAPAKEDGSAKLASGADGSATAEAKPSRTKMARAALGNEGSELVASGERYLYGRGAARSCDQAVSYFNAAAAKQNPQAFSHLGALYATGECVPMDRAAAYAWFRRAYAREPSNHYFEKNLSMLWREMSPDERQKALGKQ
jgi:hypothetical protein